MTVSEGRSDPDRDRKGSATCTRPWCVTAHGETSHPDDEDHRSAGLGVAVHTRSRAGRGHRTIAEVGLLQRRTDPEVWLVIEDGAGLHAEVTLESARRIVRAVAADPVLRDALVPSAGDARA
ncbi:MULTISPECIES: hypothetical protein [unclassified Microbacterium]|uniref:hypothetical protein n=1 Tax=unclassified Microbacterium TaxID=2609290 RepID=UPI003017B5EC